MTRQEKRSAQLYEDIKAGNKHSTWSTYFVLHQISPQDLTGLGQYMLFGYRFAHYEELASKGVDSRQFWRFLNQETPPRICYLAGEGETLAGILERLSASGELYSLCPIRIALLGAGTEGEQTPLSWIKGVQTQRFSSREEAVDWLFLSSDDVSLRAQLQGTFHSKAYSYAKLLEVNSLSELRQEYSPFAAGFFRNIMLSRDLHESVMMAFDYIEFLLSSVHYYFKAAFQDRQELQGRILSYEDHYRELLRIAAQDPVWYGVFTQSIPMTEYFPPCFQKIDRYFGIEVIWEDEFNMYGLFTILQKVRNRTRGHGVITGRSGLALWELLFFTIFYIEHAWMISDFHWDIQDGQVLCGWMFPDGDGRIPAAPYIIAEGGVPCITYELRKNREYINYFFGQYSVPEITPGKDG